MADLGRQLYQLAAHPLTLTILTSEFAQPILRRAGEERDSGERTMGVELTSLRSKDLGIGREKSDPRTYTPGTYTPPRR